MIGRRLFCSKSLVCSKIMAALLGVSLLGCQPGPDGSTRTHSADAVYIGAKIFTSDPAAPYAQALAIKGDTVIYIGDQAGVTGFVADTTTQYDVSGKLILPGIIDGHVHPGYIARFNDLLELPAAQSKSAQLADIEALLKANPDAPIIHATGWDNRFYGIEGPTKDMLDALEPERPVILHDITMHSVWVNSKALALASVDRSTPDPLPGVAYYQRRKDGELTGYITESAATDFVAKAITLGQDVETVLAEFIDYLSAQGVTTVFDAGNFGADDEIYAMVSALERDGRLPVRYHGSYTLYLPSQLPKAIETLKRLGAAYNSDRVRIDTLKVFFDGVVETRTAHMLQDYSDTPGNRGGALFGEAAMRQLIVDLDREQLHLHVHSLGDQAVRTTLNAVEAAQNILGRPLRIRVTLTHLQVVDPADFQRFGALGVIAQFTPAWHGNDAGVYDAALGPRLTHQYPAAALHAGGATLSFSSDVYFSSEWHDGSANPFTGIQVGHTRQFPGDPLDGPTTGPSNEKLPISQMIAGYTIGAAKQLGAEGYLGSLERGKRADFVILQEDLFDIDPVRIRDIKPVAVILNGEVVKGALALKTYESYDRAG